jgi:hypothetical protein
MKGKHNSKNKNNRTKGKEREKARLLNTISVVVQTTLQRNAELPNTWLNYTKNP